MGKFFESVLTKIQHPVVSATATILLLAIVGWQQRYTGPVSWGQHIMVDAAFPVLTIVCYLLSKIPSIMKRFQK